MRSFSTGSIRRWISCTIACSALISIEFTTHISQLICSGDERALLIWCHPSHSTTVLKQLLETLKLTKEENVDSEESAEVKAPRSVDEWRLRSYRIRTDVYKGPSFKVILTAPLRVEGDV